MECNVLFLKLSWVCAATSTSMITILYDTHIVTINVSCKRQSVLPWTALTFTHASDSNFRTLASSLNIRYTWCPALCQLSKLLARVLHTFLHRVLKCHPPFNPPVMVLWNTLFNLHFHTYNKTLLSSRRGGTAVLICFVNSNLSLEWVFQQCVQIWCQWGL